LTEYVIEPEKRVTVIHDVEVAVAGGGVSGAFAAMAASMHGASTLLIERFGNLGGNIGPGMICQGHMSSGQPHPKAPYEAGIYPGFMGLAKEFIERYRDLGGGCLPPDSPCHYPRDSNIASYVMGKMLEEKGVELMLSTYASDPIVNGDRVRGIFVEGKSGRRAVRAEVVIDATGDVDVVRRAGAPIMRPRQEYQEQDGHSPTGMGFSFVIGGIDWERYLPYERQHPPSEGDIQWARDSLGEEKARKFEKSSVLGFLKRAWAEGKYGRQEIQIGGSKVGTKVSFSRIGEEDLAWGLAAPERVEALDVGDSGQISILEAKLRAYVFETVQVFRDYMPGFEDAYLLTIAPYLGSRGGPCIEGEYTLTLDECKAAKRFDDVIYLYGEFRALRHTCEEGECRWTDVPYRVMVPKRIDGLLCTGRSASGIPDTLLRNRMAVKHMGEACGTAAALCVRKKVAPRDLDVRELQRVLLDSGFYLGDDGRLRELGLGE